ncbi:ATP-grasp domain-containing protein [Rhodohalobacter sp. SW132]|uniref:sugar-transfer associated ATP-grasp domain-containing protein n=1 Tax=Rhodohalobacter sp. SW132 TaxID=2293433 RepID=UPI000E21FB07|nr:sugar-transfer associated ATP-grasp domain-containing protein [Rhodohalobacter sp. SW132]REL23993.1 ATP-grasp domain-containing protein [Rhodohalobacter sp. SW132]
MITSILQSQQPVRDIFKKLAYYISLRRAAGKRWGEKYQHLFKTHPHLNQPLPPDIQKKHRDIWEPFNRDFSDDTLKFCSSFSGNADPKMIPEEIFRADIEPSLNRYPEAHFQAHKSFYNRWFSAGIFPDDLLHVISGEILDHTYSTLSFKDALMKCANFTYPVVVKPNKDSYGGKGIRFVESAGELRKIIRNRKNIVVQKKIRQHPEMARFYEESLNTVRVYLYKSVKDNRIHILGMMPRMGNGGGLDNISSGGIASYIEEDGTLCGFAFGRNMKKFTEHPVSGTPFTGTLPRLEELKKLSIKVAGKLFLLRIVGLDLCYDHTGRWRVIEINTTGHTIRSIQHNGKPFFGRFTGEVIEYCKRNHWAKGR